MELTAHFAAPDVDEAIEVFRRALAKVPDAQLLAIEPAESPDKWGVLESAETIGFTIVLSQNLLVLKPVLLFWLGKGKVVRLKSGENEVLLENWSEEQVERLLQSLGDATTRPSVVDDDS
jgi:hypothetical protein